MVNTNTPVAAGLFDWMKDSYYNNAFLFTPQLSRLYDQMGLKPDELRLVLRLAGGVQLFQFSRLRAIENRRSIARCSKQGLSGYCSGANVCVYIYPSYSLLPH